MHSCNSRVASCEYCSGPRHLLKSIVGYGNVAINRQQPILLATLEVVNCWSVSGVDHLLHSSASPSAPKNLPRPAGIVTNVCTNSALMKYQQILMQIYAHSARLNCFWDRIQVSGNLYSIKKNVSIFTESNRTSALA